MRPLRWLPVWLLFTGWIAPLGAQSKQYLEDFEFIQKTVASNGAAVRSKKIDWDRLSEELRPQFAGCSSDAEHVANVMQLLALLRDSHTGVTRHSAGRAGIPGRTDGMFGGGAWFGWDHGLVSVRGLLPGHSLEGQLVPGSVVLEVNGEPTWWCLTREMRRIERHFGISSWHSHWASMSNRMLPFGAANSLALRILDPSGDERTISLPKWGPGGKAFNPSAATTPEEASGGNGAVSAILQRPDCDKLGYLRITGGMNEATAAAFHAAFDRLQGMEVLLLDCRGMGGGSDGSAWEMAGRLFEKAVSNGAHGSIEPSGSWQWDGPVVTLQDERQVSAAETFTWAVNETERVISVGRRTGGWAIIPRGFQCPSGLVSFRLGTRDRGTPIEGIKTEGLGWAPDVEVPYGPVLAQLGDPVREVGEFACRLLAGGAKVKDVRSALQLLARGQHEKFAKQVARWKLDVDHTEWKKRFDEDLRVALMLEAAHVNHDDVAPDVIGAQARAERLLARGKAAGLKQPTAALTAALKKAKREEKAQRAALEGDLDLSERDLRSFLKRHAGSRLAEFLED